MMWPTEILNLFQTAEYCITGLINKHLISKAMRFGT